MNSDNKVVLYLYDLSNGMAKQLSPALLQKQIDGIWHTGIIVYHKEYYYGGGICCSPPKMTPFGAPIKQIELGTTSKQQSEFLQFLEAQKQEFSDDKYDLFYHNCNNFTNVCSQFLLNKGIPDFIIDLPQTVLRTPLGSMIKPLVDNMTAQMNQQSKQQSMFSNTSTNQTVQNVSSSNNTVVEINSIEQYFGILDDNDAVIMDFYSLTCPPCTQIKPIFAQKASNYPQIKFCAINVSTQRELASTFEISSIPTFIIYWKADQIATFKGANQTLLNQYIQQLLTKTNTSQQSNNSLNSNIQQNPVAVEQPKKQEKRIFDFKLFDPHQKFNYYYENDKIQIAYNKVLEQYTGQPQNAIINKLLANQLLDKNEQEVFVKMIVDCTIIEDGCNDFNKKIPYYDILRLFILKKEYQQIIEHQYPDLLKHYISYLQQPAVHRNIKMLIMRIINNYQKNSSIKSIQNVLETILLEGLEKEENKNIWQVNVLIYQNMKENGYSLEKEDEYVDKILKEWIKKEMRDDLTELGICMLLLRYVYKNENKIKRLKEIGVDGVLGKLKQSQDVKVGQLVDDILIILHRLKE